jgi:hypothetical protein
MATSPRYQMPTERPLKAYAFDPSQGRNPGNYMTVNVRHEPLSRGPVGEYLAVIDYDTGNNCYYEPVDLNEPSVLAGGRETDQERRRRQLSRWFGIRPR